MERIVKYTRPTHYDHANYGQIWVAELENGREQWIQLSLDEKVSIWSRLGDFLEDNISEEEIEKILKRYM